MLREFVGRQHPVAEVESKFMCGRMNRYYIKFINLCTITHTWYAKYTILGELAR
jgi:hypothetical protein